MASYAPYTSPGAIETLRDTANHIERSKSDDYLVPERKLSFSPISASDKNFNPRNTNCIPAVKILIFLDLDKKS